MLTQDAEWYTDNGKYRQVVTLVFQEWEKGRDEVCQEARKAVDDPLRSWVEAKGGQGGASAAASGGGRVRRRRGGTRCVRRHGRQSMTRFVAGWRRRGVRVEHRLGSGASCEDIGRGWEKCSNGTWGFA